MVAKITVLVCFLSSITTVAMGVASTAGLTPEDAFIVLFVIGPYVVLALLAWRYRNRLSASRLLLALVSVMSVWGLYIFGEDCYRYFTEPEYRKVQRMAVLVVPLVQWPATLLSGVVLAIWFRPRPDGETTD